MRRSIFCDSFQFKSTTNIITVGSAVNYKINVRVATMTASKHDISIKYGISIVISRTKEISVIKLPFIQK